MPLGIPGLHLLGFLDTTLTVLASQNGSDAAQNGQRGATKLTYKSSKLALKGSRIIFKGFSEALKNRNMRTLEFDDSFTLFISLGG